MTKVDTTGQVVERRAADMVTQSIELRAEIVIKQLISKAQMIRDNMDQLIDKLRREGINANINTLGELQSLGSDLDRLCGEFGVYRETLALMAILKEDAE